MVMLERWDVYPVPTKASAKKREKKERVLHEVRRACCFNESMGKRGGKSETHTHTHTHTSIVFMVQFMVSNFI